MLMCCGNANGFLLIGANNDKGARKQGTLKKIVDLLREYVQCGGQITLWQLGIFY